MSLLVSWPVISAYLQRTPRRCQQMVKYDGLPVMKYGRTVATSAFLIDQWLMERGRIQRERRAQGIRAPRPDWTRRLRPKAAQRGGRG